MAVNDFSVIQEQKLKETSDFLAMIVNPILGLSGLCLNGLGLATLRKSEDGFASTFCLKVVYAANMAIDVVVSPIYGWVKSSRVFFYKTYISCELQHRNDLYLRRT